MEDQLVQQLSKSENPSIRYLIKRDYLGMPENSSEVTADRGAIRTSPFVEKLLQMRREDGKFPWHAYAKWKGAFWIWVTRLATFVCFRSRIRFWSGSWTQSD
jgi:hypothetical protein